MVVTGTGFGIQLDGIQLDGRELSMKVDDSGSKARVYDPLEMEVTMKGVPVIGFWRTTPDRIKYPSEEAEYMRRVAHTVGMKRRHFKKKYPILYRDLINYLRKRLNKYNS